MPAEGRGRLLGLIGCRLFEDEISYVLGKDEELSRIWVVENEESGDIVPKLVAAGAKGKVALVKESDLGDIPEASGYAALVWLKPMALHQKPEKLNEEVQATIARLQPICGAVLLFYGLCGNAFKRIEDETAGCHVPVVILRDGGGRIVDDCIGTVLGGTEEYYQQLKRSSGTFFLTPMWAANWRELFHKVQILADPHDIEGARYVFKCVGYRKVCKMDTGLGDQRRFDDQIDEFARLFEFEKGVIPCTLNVVEMSYRKAKGSLPGLTS